MDLQTFIDDLRALCDDVQKQLDVPSLEPGYRPETEAAARKLFDFIAEALRAASERPLDHPEASDDDVVEAPAPDCAHEWVVFGTGGRAPDTALMLECAACGAYGTVHHATAKEWLREKPYQWADAARVVFRSEKPYGGYRHLEKRQMRALD